MRRLLQAGSQALILLVLMFFGSLGLWIAMPVFWLWVGGRVQGATQSLGAALARGVALRARGHARRANVETAALAAALTHVEGSRPPAAPPG